MSIDIEITNRCNAKCHFCPRDQTPHQGLMSREVFDQSLLQAIAYRSELAQRMPADMHLEADVSLCGLGEPLLNRDAARFVEQVRSAGIPCSLSSNASLLNEQKGRALLDAGLSKILINIGDTEEEYERVYKLPFERTRDNIVNFAEMAKGECEVWIVLVDHHRDADHLARMQAYWRAFGLKRFMSFDIMNRGGSLFVDHMQYEQMPELARARAMTAERGHTLRCSVPFAYLFIGYDGQYYLCCSDWRKETPMGSVFDRTFLDVTRTKLELVTSRDRVCNTCNLDPLNRLTEELRAVSEGESTPERADELVDAMVAGGRYVEDLVARLGVDPASVVAPAGRRLIPVTGS